MVEHGTTGAVPVDGWLLAFDTSTPVAVIAVGRRDEAEPRATFELGAGANQASERLVEHLVKTIHTAGVRASQLDAIAVGRGPGTFTGTRVALATAKGMALGLGRPLHPISTLACVAASLVAPPRTRSTRLVAVLDARKGEVYAGLAAQGRSSLAPATTAEIDDERCVAPTTLANALAGLEDVELVGPGVAPYAAQWPSTWRLHATEGPTPLGLWTVAVTAVAAGKTAHPSAVDATYLRASYAELGINVPKRSVWRNPALDEA